MSLDTVLDAVRVRAETLWPGIAPEVPLAWPNETADAAGGALPSRDASGAAKPFIRFDLSWNGGEFESVGAPGDNLARRQGSIWVYALVPQGSGARVAHRLAGQAGHMFEGADFGGIVCQAMSPGGAIDDENGLYYGQSASIPFTFDETA